MEEGSSLHIVHAPRGVKSWIDQPPSVNSVRPARCPACGAASRPVGSGLVLWGHGTRERTLWGPMTPDGSPTQITILVRRYRCRACDVSCTVVPQGVAARYRYTGPAIALALGLWSALKWPPAKVRAAISPWSAVGASQVGRWRSLGRWTRDVSRGRLLGGVTLHSVLTCGPIRDIATRIAELAAGRGPPSDRHLGYRHRFWRGGEAMA